MNTHYICYTKRYYLVRISTVFFVLLVSLFLGSCPGFNLFAVATPNLDHIINGNTDYFIYSLDRDDVAKAFRNNESSRIKAIDILKKRIKTTAGDRKTKNLIGLASVLTKTTILFKEYKSSVLSNLLNSSNDDHINDIVRYMFTDIKDNAKNISRVIHYSMRLKNRLSELGSSIKNHGVPAGHEQVKEKYAGYAALSGMIALMVDTIIIVDEHKQPKQTVTPDERHKAVVEYLSGANTEYTFDFDPKKTTVKEAIFKGKDEGLKYILQGY